jgi:hypothetical protein
MQTYSVKMSPLDMAAVSQHVPCCHMADSTDNALLTYTFICALAIPTQYERTQRVSHKLMQAYADKSAN